MMTPDVVGCARVLLDECHGDRAAASKLALHAIERGGTSGFWFDVACAIEIIADIQAAARRVLAPPVAGEA